MLPRPIRWNSPFYGAADPASGWFLSMHCMTRYVKVTFLNGGRLDPPPPELSKLVEVRYAHLSKHDGPDDATLTRWITQAASLPGEACF